MASPEVFDGLSRAPATCVWQSEQLPPALPSPLAGFLRGVIDDLGRGQLPLPLTIMPFERHGACRPVSHRRCFYVDVPASVGGGVLAIKGGEPNLVEDLQMLIFSGVVKTWDTHHNMSIADVFPIKEQKVPMALTLSEAVKDAQRGAEVLSIYGKRYDDVPLLPVALAAFRWPDSVAETLLGLLRTQLHRYALEIVETQIAGGLGCYVYYYPVAAYPRVRDRADALGVQGRKRFERLQETERPGVTIQRWLDLFTRLMAAGLLPATPAQQGIGQAVKAQNVVVGGGFTDVDSCRAMLDVPDWRDFVESYNWGLETMARTIGCYCFDGFQEFTAVTPFALTLMHTASRVKKLLEADVAAHGPPADPRLMRMPPFSDDFEAFAREYQAQPSLHASSLEDMVDELMR